MKSVILGVLMVMASSNATGAQAPTTTKPVSIVLVHGAFVDASGWRPVYEALNLSWINEGCSRESMYWTPPAEFVARMVRGTAPAQETSAAE